MIFTGITITVNRKPRAIPTIRLTDYVLREKDKYPVHDIESTKQGERYTLVFLRSQESPIRVVESVEEIEQLIEKAESK